MDPEVAGLALAAANSLIDCMAQDAWDHVKVRISSLLSRNQPTAAPGIASSLDRTQSQVAGDRSSEVIRREAVREWSYKLEALSLLDSDLLSDLHGVFGSAPVTVATRASDITLQAKADRGGIVFQQGQGNQVNR